MSLSSPLYGHNPNRASGNPKAYLHLRTYGDEVGMRLESCYKIARYHTPIIAAVIKLYASAYNYIRPGKAIHPDGSVSFLL